MRSILPSLLAALAAASAAAAASAVISVDGSSISIASEDVLELTAANIAAALSLHDPLLIQFYVPSGECAACVDQAPAFAAAAAALGQEGGPRLARMNALDADNRPHAMRLMKSFNFPAISWVKGGVAEDYKGGRDAVSEGGGWGGVTVWAVLHSCVELCGTPRSCVVALLCHVTLRAAMLGCGALGALRAALFALLCMAERAALLPRYLPALFA